MSSSFTPSAALAAALLASTAAVPAFADPKDAVATTPAAEDDDPQRSDEIVVLGKSYGQRVGKTVTPQKDVPNTITVIDQEQLQQRNLFTLEDALTATVGITVNGVGSEDPSFLSRGFAINNYLVDGVPTLGFGFPAVVPDLFLYDRLEVLRGPAGLFSGSGSPAGSINLVRKRPLDTFAVNALAGYGSYANYRGELDVSVPFSDRAGVRLGAMVQDQDQFFDTAHRYRFGAFGVADTEIGDRTTLTVGGNYELFKPAVQSGLPGLAGGADGSDGRLLDIDRSTYLGADWNRFRSESWSGFVELAHRISDRWTLRATGLYTDIDRVDVYSYIGNQPITAANRGVTSHIGYRGDSTMQTRAVDFNGVGSFPLFGRDQTLILGADYQARSTTSANARRSNYATINVYDPVSPAEPDLNPYTLATGKVVGASEEETEQYGLYGQLRLSPAAGLTLVGGARLTWWDTRSVVTSAALVRGPQTGYGIDNRLTPYGGVVWDVTPALNLYVSYADSFTPQSSGVPRFDGGAIAPLVGQQVEAGTKLSLFNDRLLLSAAAYQIEQKNRLFTDADLPGVVFQIGKVRSRGIEVEANGEILPGWRINGGYAYNKNVLLEDTQAQFEGISFVPVVPEHMVKAFTNYAPTDGMLKGLSLGGGVTWFSDTAGGNPSYVNAAGVRVISTRVNQGSYAVVDLRAGYKLTERVSLAVNVNNLFDRTYYARISATGRGNYYGSPRTAFASVRVSFP